MKYDLLMNVDLHKALDEALQEMVRDDYGRNRWGRQYAHQFFFLFIDKVREQLAEKGLYRWTRNNEDDGNFWFLPVDEAEEMEAFQEVVRLGKKKEAARQAYLDLSKNKPSLLQRVNDFLRGRWYGA